MRSCAFTAAILTFGICLTGCAATTTTNKVAIDYNRVFAKSRDEVLVTNILRASAREPLQFSTMGTVTGGVRNSGSVTIPFTNLIGGTDGLTISPSATLNDGINPTVNIVPLENKDFAEGILKPIALKHVSYFLNQGWDPEFVLMMAVGAVQCPHRIVRNTGAPPDDSASNYEAFADLFNVRQVTIRSTEGETVFTTVRMAAKDAIPFIKEGVGDDYKIKSAIPVKGDPKFVDVEIVEAAGTEMAGPDVNTFCAKIKAKDDERRAAFTGSDRERQELAEQAARTAVETQNAKLEGSVHIAGSSAKFILRSVESMIYFLGQTHRYLSPSDADWPWYKRTRWLKDPATTKYDYFPEKVAIMNIERSQGPVPITADVFMRTSFNRGYYFIPHVQEAPLGTRCLGLQCDRTTTTLSFLNELIALQTNPTSVTSATPVINVGSK